MCVNFFVIVIKVEVRERGREGGEGGKGDGYVWRGADWGVVGDILCWCKKSVFVRSYVSSNNVRAKDIVRILGRRSSGVVVLRVHCRRSLSFVDSLLIEGRV